jgi:hypothetical protein
MRAGDLEGNVLPVISVDEYVSKIDDSAVVIGFFVDDEDAANDLARFIQRTAIQILDTDVSPAPDTEGRYMVFVEIEPTQEFGKAIVELCREVSALTEVSTWKMHIRGDENALPLSAKVLNAKFAPQARDERDRKSDDVNEPVNEDMIRAFLYDSLLEGVEFEDTFVALDLAPGDRRIFEMAAFDRSEFVLSRLGLEGAPIDQDLGSLRATASLAEGLGEDWWCHRVGEYDIIGRGDNSFVLALKP